MSRPDQPTVYWKHFAHGYEARLESHGPAFARAWIVTGVPGAHYELRWIHGPRNWRSLRVFNVMTIETLVDRYVAHHRKSLMEKMPPNPMRLPHNLPIVPAPPDSNTIRSCERCGRRWGACSRTVELAERRRGVKGWPCSAAA